MKTTIASIERTKKEEDDNAVYIALLVSSIVVALGAIAIAVFYSLRWRWREQTDAFSKVLTQPAVASRPPEENKSTSHQAVEDSLNGSDIFLDFSGGLTAK